LNNLTVRCYSGHTYAERPQSFCWEGKEYEVTAIEKDWQEPGKKCFQVRTRDSKLCQLCYNDMENTWSIIELTGGN
jgi:hypothetical protein